MPTTTEPPYTNKSRGIAARNGTTTHTINFTTDGNAPFTPTAGRLLVFIIFGPVTHTGPGGIWTEQLQPVNSGELSVFTCTAAGTAGTPSSTTSIAITNGSSNFPNAWELKEYPAGSTYVSGIGDSQTATSGPPTLTSGLVSGTPRVIETATGLVSSSTGDAATGTTWNSPFLEDSDQFTIRTTNDGAYLTTAHQINNTTTSVTPTSSDSSSGLAVNNRQAVTFAIDATPPSTPFTKNTTESYRVFNTFTKDSAESYRVLNSFTKDTTESYRVLNGWTLDKAESYRVFSAFTKDTAESYRVFNSWTKDTSESYRVLNAWTKDSVEQYRVLNSWAKDASDSWRVLNAFTKDVADSWNVLSGTSFTKNVVEQYRVLNAFVLDVAEQYRILNSWQAERLETYRVLNGWQLNKTDSWRVYALFTKDIVERYQVFSDILPTPLTADVTAYLEARVATNLTAERVIAQL